jgi:hypothetical protein
MRRTTVWRLDGLGRSLPHLIETVGTLERRDIGFRSLTENLYTTTAATGHDLSIAHKPVTPHQLGRVLDQQLQAMV